MKPVDYNNPEALGNFGLWPAPPRRPMYRRRGPIAAALATVVVSVVVLAGVSLAHHIDVIRACKTVTVESFSDGVGTVIAQTGDVFAVGQTIQPGNPGTLTKPAQPNQGGSVTVTWTTDHGSDTATWGEEADCIPVTIPTTPTTPPPTQPPTTPPTNPPTTPSTAPPTTPPTAPPTTPSTAPPTTPTTGNPCDHKTPEDTLPPQCFPTTTAPATTVPPTAPPTTVFVCAQGFIAVTDDQGTVHCTPTLIPSVTQTAVPTAATPAFTG